MLNPQKIQSLHNETQNEFPEIVRGYIEENLTEHDYILITSIAETTEASSAAPHELGRSFLVIEEEKYASWIKYVRENEEKFDFVDYSWQGRVLVVAEGLTLDTGAASQLESDAPTASTRHGEFKWFYEKSTGSEFPTVEQLNTTLSSIAAGSLAKYNEALAALKNLSDLPRNQRPPNAKKLYEGMALAVMILTDASSGEALEELPETISGSMPEKMRHYADVTYNAEHIVNIDEVVLLLEKVDITTSFTDEERIDRVMTSHGIASNEKMEDLCKDFSKLVWGS